MQYVLFRSNQEMSLRPESTQRNHLAGAARFFLGLATFIVTIDRDSDLSSNLQQRLEQLLVLTVPPNIHDRSFGSSNPMIKRSADLADSTDLPLGRWEGSDKLAEPENIDEGVLVVATMVVRRARDRYSL